MECGTSERDHFLERIRQLYPMVDIKETPLPSSWSQKDKFQDIGLTHNNMRAHYKGNGKSNKDAASVRANHPIPASCGLYYFEVTIISKGRDGYMGIGLTQQGTNLNRLPGWEKYSYGYHGDDGDAFNSTTTGRTYGPTFSTGDVVGCGLNLVDNTCFYTKNGHNLGVAVSGLRPDLYPTVGLQTPGETVHVNFGQAPFVFNIEATMVELRANVRRSIQNFPAPESVAGWQHTLHKMVQTYLVHHGYSQSAEAFARSTNIDLDEDITSIRHRQKIQTLVLSGRMGEAIEVTQRLYPQLLESQHNLLFLLRVRQFIEMVNGTDTEVLEHGPCEGMIKSSEEVVGVVKQRQRLSDTEDSGDASTNVEHMNRLNDDHGRSQQQQQTACEGRNVINGVDSHGDAGNGYCVDQSNGAATNGHSAANDCSLSSSSTISNGHGDQRTTLCEQMDVDRVPSAEQLDCSAAQKRRTLCGGSVSTLEKVLHFGRQLQLFYQRLKLQHGENDYNKNLLQDAFSLLAYTDPWNSPVKWQLDPVQREAACAALNSAILSSHQLPRRPPLEVALSHSKQVIGVMARAGLGSCAFANIDSLFQSAVMSSSTAPHQQQQ